LALHTGGMANLQFSGRGSLGNKSSGGIYPRKNRHKKEPGANAGLPYLQCSID